MLGRPPVMAFAIFASGSFSTRAPLAAKTPGGSPRSTSPTIRPSLPIGISAAKRWTFSQSTPASTWKRSSMHSTGRVAIRIIAAASPPRICGPEERVISA